jgi:hypothetical protein
MELLVRVFHVQQIVIGRLTESVYRPLDEFEYNEIAEGWREWIETRPDGTTIRHVEIDLTKVPPDAADYDRDIPSWDLGPRPPRYREVKDLMGL